MLNIPSTLDNSLKEHLQVYVKKFDSWEAKKIEIDDTRAYWELRKPGSRVEKICLYRDGYTMFVYGDYSNIVFDAMTWLGAPDNLPYDNMPYLMEKLSKVSLDAIHVYDEESARDDIIDWIKYKIRTEYSYLFENDEKYKEGIEKIENFVREQGDVWYYDESEISEFCEENELFLIEDLIKFTANALSHTDEYEWVSFLRGTDFSSIGEEYNSDLWDAGKRIDQRFYINMYALKLISEKLRNEDNTTQSKEEEE